MRAIYRRRVIKAGATIEVEETYPTRFGEGLTRSQHNNSTGTTVAMQIYNEERAMRELTRLINENFVPGDFWVTLHYEKDNRPQSFEEARAQLSSFLIKLRSLYKKSGKEIKYLKTTAIGSRGGVHHHIIINRGVDTRKISFLWREHIKASISARPPHYVELYEDREYSSLAAYIYNQAKGMEEDYKNARHWVGSRNLKKPQVIKDEIIEGIKWKEPPTAPRGYYIDKDSIKAGCNPISNKPYLFYRAVKITEGFTCYDEKGRKLTGKAAASYYRKIKTQWIRDNWDELNPEGEIIFKGVVQIE